MTMMAEKQGSLPFHKKTVVITGASSGGGRAAPLAFRARGATVIVAARRNEALQELVRECTEAGGTALAVPTDVTHPDEMLRLAKAAVGFSGRIDVWVNNAGVLAAGELTSTPVDVIRQVVETNLLGYIYGAHAVLPYFKRQGSGILINNISVGAWFPTPYASAYTASKYGLKGFTQSLRGELTHWPGIRVCDLFSGFLDTPGIHHAANYTGRALAPAPPVYDPRRVALAMVSLAQSPRNRMTTDLLAPALRMAHQLFPAISRRVTAGVIETYLKKADPETPNSGNVLSPLRFGTSVDGGWTSRFRRKTARAGAVLALFLGTGLLLAAASHR